MLTAPLHEICACLTPPCRHDMGLMVSTRARSVTRGRRINMVRAQGKCRAMGPRAWPQSDLLHSLTPFIFVDDMHVMHVECRAMMKSMSAVASIQHSPTLEILNQHPAAFEMQGHGKEHVGCGLDPALPLQRRYLCGRPNGGESTRYQKLRRPMHESPLAICRG